jgi:hypothetical protein
MAKKGKNKPTPAQAPPRPAIADVRPERRLADVPPKSNAPVGLSAPVSTVNPKPVTSSALPKPPKPTRPPVALIDFGDVRVKWYLGIVIAFFVIATLLKFHNVSVAIWNQILPDGSDAKRGLISGAARQIRMDDYAVSVPWLLSSANQGLPLENEVIGGGKAGLFLQPNHHIFMLFKPNFWGFLFLDTERAVSWMYNLNATAILLSAFLLFMLLTANNFWLSVSGALWLWLSSGSQAWVFGASLATAYFVVLFISGVYLLFGEKRDPLRWLAWGLVFGWALYSAVFLLYPPYQVPLGYTFLFVFIGYVLNHRNRPALRYQLPLKIALGIAGFAAITSLVFLIYPDLKPTLDATTATVYPGRRSDLGGTGFIANWFSEYFHWQITDQKFPAKWLNSCELSHYITFYPVIAVCAAGWFAVTRKVDWMIALLVVFVGALLVWMEFGWPKWLAEGTLMSMSPTRRTQIPLGVASVLLTIIYVDYFKDKFRSVNLGINALAIAGVVAFMIYAAWVNVTDGEGFFKSYQLFLPTLFFGGLNLLLLPTLKIPYKTAIFGTGITLAVLPNLTLNPLAVGLSPITENVIYKEVQDVAKTAPDARWVVLGSQYISYMVTATGVKLISGVKFIPSRNIMKVLDPTMKRDSVYNRYAHTVYNTYIDPAHPDSVVFQNPFEDGYNVSLDPCSPKLKKLNVRFVIFDHQPQPVEVRCMKLRKTLGSISIYERTDL